MLIRRQSS